MLLIELESKFDQQIFPNLDLPALITATKVYEKNIPPGKVRSYVANLEFLHISLNILLTAFTPREAIAFYLLVSYLRKHKADNSNLKNELSEFAREFLKNLNSFSIYDDKPPKGMSKDLFALYKKYKQESKILTTSESLKNRLEIMVSEFDRLHPIIMKDPIRLHDAEQKRTLYFKQSGICPECGKEMVFDKSSAHHVVAHSKGGRTDDLTKSVLLHEKCHQKLEKKIKKEQSNAASQRTPNNQKEDA